MNSTVTVISLNEYSLSDFTNDACIKSHCDVTGTICNEYHGDLMGEISCNVTLISLEAFSVFHTVITLEDVY